MQFATSLLILLISGVSSENGLCQKWCYRLKFNAQVQMVCCSYTEKAGMCSSPNYAFKNEIKLIHCSSDCSCPWGFKCCQNDWARSKICVPVLEPRSNEQTTTIGPATTTTQSRTTTKEKLVVFKTTKPETTGLPQTKIPIDNSITNAITTTTTRPATRTTQPLTTTTQSRTTTKEKLVVFKTSKPETTGLPPPNRRSLPDEDSENIYI